MNPEFLRRRMIRHKKPAVVPDSIITPPPPPPPPPLPTLLRCGQRGSSTTTTGWTGMLLQVDGTPGFPNDGTTTIDFGGTTVPASAITWFNTSLLFSAPAHATGTITVTVTTSVGTTNSVSFTVTTAPSIPVLLRCGQRGASSTFQAGLTGDPLQVDASSAFPNDNLNTINFGGVTIPASAITWFSTSLLFTAPAHAVGSITVTVTTSAGATNSVPFTVNAPAPPSNPTVLHLAQQGNSSQYSGKGGDGLRLDGSKAFPNDGVTTINFGALVIPASSITWLGTSLLFTCPTYYTGPVTVYATTSLGRTNSVTFTYVTTDVTQALGFFQEGYGAAGVPSPQTSYQPLANPDYVAHQVHWGLCYLPGDPWVSGSTVNWAGYIGGLGGQISSNYKFMQDGGKVDYSMGMLPGWKDGGGIIRYATDGSGPLTLARGATGEFDQHWRDIAAAIADSHTVGGAGGYPNMQTIWLNLGFEFNQGPNAGESWTKWFPWGVGSMQEARDYARYYQRIVDAMRSSRPGRFKFTWNFNGGTAPAYPGLLGPYINSTTGGGYPGKAHVDAVGCEMYFQFGTGWANDGAGNLTAAGGTAAWNASAGNGEGQYGWLHSLAVNDGVAFAVPEWGMTDSGHNGPGDCPTVIQKMRDYTASFPTVAYVNYYNADKSDGLHGQWHYPNSRATFRALF